MYFRQCLNISALKLLQVKQEGLAVASIGRDVYILHLDYISR